jgi:hypothetical protein
MPSETESLALHLVRALYNATDGRPQVWRMLEELDRNVALVEEMMTKVWSRSLCVQFAMIGASTPMDGPPGGLLPNTCAH